MQQVSNPFQAMKDIFTKPNRVFATIKDVHNWSWIPFILVAAAGTLPIYYYFNFVDFAWYTELLIQVSAGDTSPAEQNIMRNVMPDQAQTLWATLFGSVIGVIIASAILALYLNIMTKADDECVQGFTDWYGFAWWVSVPSIVASLLGLLALFLTQDNQVELTIIAPTSLAFIFGIDSLSDWAPLLQSIRLESIWVMYLIAVGLSQWTQLPMKRNYTIAIAPYVIIFGIWTLVTAF